MRENVPTLATNIDLLKIQIVSMPSCQLVPLSRLRLKRTATVRKLPLSQLGPS